jgi:hypothetical protein
LACDRASAVSFTTFDLNRSSSAFLLASLSALFSLWGIAQNGQTVDWVVPELLGLKPLQLGN